MQHWESPFSAEPDAGLSKPRFGEEEKRRAQQVVPLNEGSANHNVANYGPHVAFRGPARKSWQRHLIMLSLLFVTAGIAMASALYAHFRGTNVTDYTQPSIQAVEQPTPNPQSPAPPQPYRTRRADVIFAEQGDEEDDKKDHGDGGDRDGRRRHWHRGFRGDDEKTFRRSQRIARMRRELRRFRELFDQ